MIDERNSLIRLGQKIKTSLLYIGKTYHRDIVYREAQGGAGITNHFLIILPVDLHKAGLLSGAALCLLNGSMNVVVKRVANKMAYRNIWQHWFFCFWVCAGAQYTCSGKKKKLTDIGLWFGFPGTRTYSKTLLDGTQGY
jgi:hypothetical protein